MLLTEEAVAAFRASSAEAPRSGVFPFGRLPRPALPDRAYSDPADVFGEGWTPPTASGLYEDVRASLRVVAVLAFLRSLPSLRFDRPWWAIRHQCGGHLNQQLEMVATPIALRPGIVGPLLEIARDGYYAEGGRFNRHDVLASRLAGYVMSLGRIGLDCEASWRHLTEGAYPIDATRENLHALSDDPPDLSSVVDWGGSLPARYSDEPVILVLTENSD